MEGGEGHAQRLVQRRMQSAGAAAAAGRCKLSAAAAALPAPSQALCAPIPPRRPQVFVLVADPQGQVLDSKEYLAPIITPHEALLAFDPAGTGGEWDAAAYRLDFQAVLQAPGLGEVRGGGAGGAGGKACASFTGVVQPWLLAPC